jgi:dTMP kinase
MSSFAMPGILIAIEGIEGVGKTTQTQLLDQALFSVGEDSICTTPPASKGWGEDSRASDPSASKPPDQELGALIDGWKRHAEAIVLPGLAAGKIVIVDQYFYSAIAWQAAKGAKVAPLSQQAYAALPIPDVAFLLELAPAAALARIRRTREETRDDGRRLERLTAVGQILRDWARRDRRLRTVDGHPDPEAVHEKIVDLLVGEVLRDKRCSRPRQPGCDSFHCSLREQDECPWFRIQQALPDRRSGNWPAGANE